MRLAVLLLAVLPAALPQDPPAGPGLDPLALRVNAAIARGVERLRAEQQPDGRFPGQEDPHPGGMTSLCAYALLKSGVRRSDPAIVRALSHLDTVTLSSTYATGCHLLLLEALNDPALWRARAEADARLLLDLQENGLWAYPWGAADMSNTQFALLGLRAAHHMGVDVPVDPLVDCAQAIFRLQAEEGGFRYEGGREPTAGMSAATLAGLQVIAEVAGEEPSVERLLRKHRRDVERGEAWLAESFAPDRNAYGAHWWTPAFLHPYLWAVERYGGLSGKEQLGGRDWYAQGAEFLVDTQKPDGGWGRDLSDTCFALLFLRRATVSGGDEELDLPADAGQAAAAAADPRAPAPDVARVRRWLVAGPWMGKPGERLLDDPPFRPERARPRERGRVDRRDWERVDLEGERWTDLEQPLGRGGDWLLWAIGAGFEVAGEEELAATLWLTVEDGWQVWLDGELVSDGRRVQAPIEETVAVDLDLAPGEHEVVVLLEDVVGASAFGARMVTRDGKAIDAGRLVWR